MSRWLPLSLNNVVLESLNFVAKPFRIQPMAIVNDAPIKSVNSSALQQDKQIKASQINQKNQHSNRGRELADFTEKYRIAKSNERRLDRQLMEAKNEINQLKRIISEDNNRMVCFQRHFKNENQRIENVALQLKKANDKIAGLEKIIDSNKDKISDFQKRVKSANQKYEETARFLKKANDEIKQLRLIQIEDKRLLKMANYKSKETQSQLRKTINLVVESQTRVQTEKRQKTKIISDLWQQLRTANKRQEGLVKQLQIAKKAIDKLGSLLDESRIMAFYHQRQAKSANQKQEKVNNQYMNLNEKIILMAISSKDKIQQLEAQIRELKLKEEQRWKQIEKSTIYVGQLNQEIQYFNGQLVRINKKEQKACQQVWDLKNQLQEIKDQILFERSILKDSPLRQELVAAIRQQSPNHLSLTKSIYFSSQAKINANFLQLKCNCNYVFVAKTQNGNYLAAVSFRHSDEQYQQFQQNRAFIIDLDNRTNFYLDEGKSSAFKIRGKDLIFGNHDLIVQMGNFIISTNIGQADSNFAASQWREGAFGQPDRVFGIESFQVFELFLADDAYDD